MIGTAADPTEAEARVSSWVECICAMMAAAGMSATTGLSVAATLTNQLLLYFDEPARGELARRVIAAIENQVGEAALASMPPEGRA